MNSTAVAVLVALGYYAGANVGLILRFPASTPSFVWPPNAILTAALLLVAPRRWWICLLAAFPAHLAAQFPASWPTPLVLGLFVTNCSEALIAAAGVRWLSDAPTRFDTLRRMAVFIVAAGLAAPFLSSFLDAGVVTVLRGESYGSVWRTRFFSNVLTELTLVPAIVMGVTDGPAWLRDGRAARRAEAVLVAAALVLVAGWVFGVVTPDPAILGTPVTPATVFLLPVILLATVRFGPGGASLCLLGTSLVAVWAAAHGRGPFASLAPAAAVLSLQILLIVLTIPILCLAAVLVERHGARIVLGERLEALHASEALQSAILGSLNTSVAVLDRAGRIVDTNPNWARVTAERGAPVSAGLGVGDNLLEAWQRAVGVATPKREEAAAGISGVLSGARPKFELEYPCKGAGERWFAMSVVRLDRQDGGAVVSCTDITERKAAELDIERSRQELTHFMRVFMMGELTASLAHELNQPLTGILTNARAGLRLLDVASPDLGELRAILSDIADDDKRAGEVIQRLRDFLRKSEPQRVALDLNVLVNEVGRMLASDAIIRNVSITIDLDERPVFVHADHVQLQQVILNLLLNAMDAMAESAAPERAIVVRARNTDLQAVHVSVEDRGPGVRAGTHELLFEPFFTTKPKGMGMGLAICRSIIETHDGVIWAEGNPAGGATFHFTLPTLDAGTS